jgi:hypothetical protein
MGGNRLVSQALLAESGPCNFGVGDLLTWRTA